MVVPLNNVPVEFSFLYPTGSSLDLRSNNPTCKEAFKYDVIHL